MRRGEYYNNFSNVNPVHGHHQGVIGRWSSHVDQIGNTSAMEDSGSVKHLYHSHKCEWIVVALFIEAYLEKL